MFVALGIQHAMRMRHSHLWPVRICNIFPYYLINGTILENVIEHKTCFDFLHNFCLKRFS
jgi:hypothetical protein